MGEKSPEFDLFLSYNRRDREVVEPLAQAFRNRKLRVFKDDWYLRPGEFWPAVLEKKIEASRALYRYPLVAVVSASGSGKSSLVRAGLIPQLL